MATPPQFQKKDTAQPPANAKKKVAVTPDPKTFGKVPPKKGSGRLPITPANNGAIIGKIEAKRPVGPGHHQSHQSNALMAWLKAQEGKKGKK